MSQDRRGLARASTVVVKIGSSSLAADGAIARLAADVVALRAQKKSVVLVSSGAIALGYKKLGYKTRPKEMAKLQAAAAVGQTHLMHAYESAFGRAGVVPAQVLLTHADLADRSRANNARAALGELLAAGAVPVLNENDSVAIDEIKFGDNDQLAALVVPLAGAELLVLLSDVEGVLDKSGRRVATIDDAATAHALVDAKKKSDIGTGGMASKVEAARRATLAGAHAIIANASTPNVLERIGKGEDLGTHFIPSSRRMNARRYWIAFTLRPRGDLILDAGAASAIARDKSLLSVGVLGVRGDFGEGDAVRLLDSTGKELARGLARVTSSDAARTAGTSDNVLVHKDDLVVLS